VAQIKYDVSDVEAGGGGEEPQPALYPGKIVGINHRTKKKNTDDPVNDLEVVVDIGEQYTRKYTYIKLPGDPSFDNSKWKLREFADAIGLGASGTIDTGAAALKKLYKPVNVKIVADTDQNGEYRGKIKNLFAPAAADKAADNGGETAEDGGSDEGPYGREEMETWTDDDLKGYAEELEVEVPKGRNARQRLIDALVDVEENTEDGAGDHDASAGNSSLLEGLSAETIAELSEDPTYYSEWSDDDIKGFISDLGIEGNVSTSGRGWRGKAVSAIVGFASEANGSGTPTDDEPEEGSGDNYEDETAWPTADLKAEIDARNEQGANIEIPGRSTRGKMIAALRSDDKEAAPF